MRIVCVVVCLCWVIWPLSGQISSLYPDQFSSYFHNTSFINPAYFPKKGKSEVLLQSKLRSGIYSDISTFGASLQKTFKSSGTQFHSGRLSFYNEQEGPYISTPRFYGQYAISISINDDLNLLGGISFGAVNPKYDTPSRSISTTIIDGAAGFILLYKKTQVGFSANQLFNNASVDNSAFRLSRYYCTYVDQTWAIDPELAVKGYLLLLLYTDIPAQYNGAISVQYQEQFNLGLGYRNTSGTYLFGAFKLNPDSAHPLSIGALYNSTILSSTQVLGASFELNLKYHY